MSSTREQYVVVLVGNPRAGSRTTRLGLAAADRLRAALMPGARVEVVELAELSGELLPAGSPAADRAQEVVGGASALVVASPVFKATYTGLLKVFLDRFAAGALGGRPTVAAMLGGSEQHRLAVEVHLRPLLAELGAHTLSGLYVTEQQLDRLEAVVGEWWAQAGAFLAPVPAPALETTG